MPCIEDLDQYDKMFYFHWITKTIFGLYENFTVDNFCYVKPVDLF